VSHKSQTLGGVYIFSWKVYCVECGGSTRQAEQSFSRFIIHASQIQKTNKKESPKKETKESHAYLH